MVVDTYNPYYLERLRQEIGKFEANLSYSMTPYIKK